MTLKIWWGYWQQNKLLWSFMVQLVLKITSKCRVSDKCRFTFSLGHTALIWHQKLTKAFNYVVYLINVWISRKQWFSCQHLYQQATNRPNIDSPEMSRMQWLTKHANFERHVLWKSMAVAFWFIVVVILHQNWNDWWQNSNVWEQDKNTSKNYKTWKSLIIVYYMYYMYTQIIKHQYLPYFVSPTNNSGARYHRVAT